MRFLYEEELQAICLAQRNRFRCSCGHMDVEHYLAGMGVQHRRCKFYPVCDCQKLDIISAFPRTYDSKYVDQGGGI